MFEASRLYAYIHPTVYLEQHLPEMSIALASAIMLVLMNAGPQGCSKTLHIMPWPLSAHACHANAIRLESGLDVTASMLLSPDAIPARAVQGTFVAQTQRCCAISALPPRGRAPSALVMTPHLSMAERDLLASWAGEKKLSPVEVHKKLVLHRAKKGAPAPNLTNVRKTLKGMTYKRSGVETRGRKRALTRADVVKMNKTRLKLIDDPKIGGKREVHWDEVIEKAGMNVSPSAVREAFQREGINVKWRRPREKPQKAPEHLAERTELCRRWRFLPNDHFVDGVDMIIDNKAWDYPADERSRTYLQRQKIRGHLRLPSEGLKPAFTKPNPKKHRINPGGSLMVCAGICNSRVAVWHYINAKWNGGVAAATYRDVIAPAMRRRRGVKQVYKVVEDNDPSGYKSNKAIAAKQALCIEAVQFPRYSPDLNPLDFFLWEDIRKRLEESAPRGKETKGAFQARLRSVAMATSPVLIRKALRNVKKRAAAVFHASGADIALD